MNTPGSLRGSRSTLSRRRDKPWRISAQLSDQRAPTPGRKDGFVFDCVDNSFKPQLLNSQPADSQICHSAKFIHWRRFWTGSVGPKCIVGPMPLLT